MRGRKHPQVRRASRIVGVATILGMMALAAPIGTSPADSLPAPAWTVYVADGSNVTPIDSATNTAGTTIPVAAQTVLPSRPMEPPRT
jgi:hypothetical protein